MTRRRRGRPDQRGESLVELMVALTIIALVLAMSTVVLTVVVSTTTTGVSEGATADSVLDGLGSLLGHLTAMTTPQNAVTASAADGTRLTLATTCWGDADPDSGSPADGSPPSSMAVDFAWDFALQFCAYPPGSEDATPHVYEALLDPATCDNAVKPPTCTLEVLDFGTAFAADQAACAAPFSACEQYPGVVEPDPEDPPPGRSTVVSWLGRVWCDAACQTGTSCQTQVAVGDPTGSCSASTVARSTPPLFNYYDAGSARSTYPSAPCQATPTGAPKGSFTCTMNLTPPTLDFFNGGADATGLGSLGAVALNLTVDPAPVGLGHPVAAAPVHITDQIPVVGAG